MDGVRVPVGMKPAQLPNFLQPCYGDAVKLAIAELPLLGLFLKCGKTSLPEALGI